MSNQTYYFGGGNKILVTDIRYHRNGVSGIGFTAITFRWMDDARQLRHMVACLTDEPGSCAVLDAGEAANESVQERWRGDHFEPALRQAVADYDARMAARYDLGTLSGSSLSETERCGLASAGHADDTGVSPTHPGRRA